MPEPPLPQDSALLGALGDTTNTATPANNLLIDLSGISCFQPLWKGGPVPRGVPWLLPYKEVRNDGPVN